MQTKMRSPRFNRSTCKPDWPPEKTEWLVMKTKLIQFQLTWKSKRKSMNLT